tara:strand:+ start:1367 stop:2422 length:1056 start_codon:yes stop_codon:yes gene_type:complete
MAYINFQPSDFFKTVIWTGTQAEHAITGVGFSSDFTWIKARSDVLGNYLFDTVRGATNALASNSGDAQFSDAQYLKSWESDGFTLGTNSAVNGTGDDVVGWNWKAGTTSGLSGGTITPSSYSINATSGFGIYKYSGTGSAGTIAHGLGAAPECVIVKKTTAVDNWWVYHLYTHSDTSTSGQYYNVFNTTDARNTNSGAWNNTNPTSTLIHIGDGGNVNTSGQDYIMYAFAPKKGFSSFGGFKGNASTDGPFCYTGFRPAFLLVKCSSTTSGGAGNWYIFDNKRVGYNIANYSSKANSSDAEATSTYLDLLSNGFKIRNAAADLNGSNADMIYLAFAEFPIVSSNSKIGTAR